MHLNCPKTIPPPVFMERVSYTKQVPGAKMVGDHWYRGVPTIWPRTWHRGSSKFLINAATPILLNHPRQAETRGADNGPRNRWQTPHPTYIPRFLQHPAALSFERPKLSTHGPSLTVGAWLGPPVLQGQPSCPAPSSPQGKIIAFRSAAAAIGQTSRSLPQRLINGQERLLRISLRTELQWNHLCFTVLCRT